MVNLWQNLGALAVGIGSVLWLPLRAIALCPAALPEAMAAIASQPQLARARLGIQVETLTGEVVLSQEGDRFFVPASTLKLLTTAAALLELGPNHTLRTPVLGTLDENGMATLLVVGQGDPSFDQSDLTELTTQLAEQGIRAVDTLYGSDRAFVGEAVNPNWEWEDVQAGYGAPVNALILNENEVGLSLVPQAVGEPLKVVWDSPANQSEWTVENYSVTVPEGEPEFVSVGRDLGRPVLRVWGQLIAGAEPETAAIAVPHPSEAFLGAFQSSLEAQGINVQHIRLGQPETVDGWSELAAVSSPRLEDLLIPTNQNSNNLYAEAILKMLGQPLAEHEDATKAGVEVALRALENLGVDPQGVVMVDGSGLARKNLITPEAMVDVLQGMARSAYASEYRASLARAGISGTLKNRLRDTPAAGRLSGKSGAISRNFALAGYLEPEAYEPVAFSIFINNINERGSVARHIIDQIVLQIASLERCPVR